MMTGLPESEDSEWAVGLVTFSIGQSSSPEIVGPNSTLISFVGGGRDVLVVPDSTEIIVHEIPAQRIDIN